MMALATCLMAGSLSASAQTDQKKQSFESFNSITINGDFDVTLTPDKEYTVSVTTDQALLPYVEVSVLSRNLDISVGKLPKELRKAFKGKSAPGYKIVITAPEISAISLDGNVVLTASAEMTARKNLSVTLGGKSQIKRLECDVDGKASVAMSKNATAELILSAEQLSIASSGSSALRVTYDVTGFVAMNAKNSALISATGESEDVTVVADGSAKLSISGTADGLLDVTGDGSASIDALHLAVKKAKAVLDGATLIEAATESLSMELSDRSTLIFDKTPELTIVSIKTSTVTHYTVR